MKHFIFFEELKTSHGEAYFKIVAEEGNDYLKITWIGFINEQKAKNGLLKELEAIKVTKRTKLLVDNRKQKGPFPKEIQPWIENYWFLQTRKIGFLKSAQVLSESAFTEYSAKKLEETLEQEYAVLVNFDNKEDALKWLKKQ